MVSKLNSTRCSPEQCIIEYGWSKHTSESDVESNGGFKVEERLFVLVDEKIKSLTARSGGNLYWPFINNFW